MSRFNTNKTKRVRRTTSHEGGATFTKTKERELVDILLTSLVQDKFYENANSELGRLSQLAKEVDPLFAAKAAVYARDKFFMRSITHALAGEIALNVKGVEWTKNFFDKIVFRPDDAIEIMAYIKGNQSPVPNSVKKGFSMAFKRFDGYQLMKYKNDNKQISLRDVINLITGGNKNRFRGATISETVDQFMKGQIEAADTWNNRLSKAGSDQDAKETAWADMVLTRKIPHMALLMNLRNISQTDNEEVIEATAELLQDRSRISRSKVLPFKYYTAYRALKEANADYRLVSACSKGLDIACENVPVFDGKTLIAIDDSGSMQWKSGNLSPAEKAAFFTAILYKSNPKIDVCTFSTSHRWVKGINPDDSTLTIASEIMNQIGSGGATHMHFVFDNARKSYDRIMVLSDMQNTSGIEHSKSDYESRYGTPFIYDWNMSAHSTSPFRGGKVIPVAGFSQEIFKLMEVAETDVQVLMNEIRKVEL